MAFLHRLIGFVGNGFEVLLPDVVKDLLPVLINAGLIALETEDVVPILLNVTHEYPCSLSRRLPCPRVLSNCPCVVKNRGCSIALGSLIYC